MRERVYVAGRFSRRHEFRRFADALTTAGHSITSRWLYSEDHHLELGGTPSPAATAAARDLEDVRAATVCVAFTERSGRRQGRGGRHVELGVALALGLRLIVVGDPEHIFHLLPEVERVATAEAALAAIGSSVALAA